jgi:tetratricopeptide (TPR) repeat protein
MFRSGGGLRSPPRKRGSRTMVCGPWIPAERVHKGVHARLRRAMDARERAYAAGMNGELLRVRLWVVLGAAAIASAFLLVAIPVWAASQRDWDDCKQADDAERTIKGCTVIIQDLDEGVTNRAFAYNARGLAYYKTRDHHRAIADFGEAIRFNPRFVEAYNKRWQHILDNGRCRPRPGRLWRGDPARSHILPCLFRSWTRLPRAGRPRPGRRRIQRSDPPRSTTVRSSLFLPRQGSLPARLDRREPRRSRPGN